jgi:hypothetical protein
MKQVVTAVVIGAIVLTTVWLSLVVSTEYLIVWAILYYL